MLLPRCYVYGARQVRFSRLAVFDHFFFSLYNKLPNLNCSGSNVGVIRSVQTAPSALININREL